MWLPEVVAIEKLHMYVRLQTARKGRTCLLCCHGLDVLVSHRGPGAVVSCESYGSFVVSLGPLACTSLANAVTPTLLLCPLVRRKAVLCLICGPRRAQAESSLKCSLQPQASLHLPLFMIPHLEGRANDT